MHRDCGGRNGEQERERENGESNSATLIRSISDDFKLRLSFQLFGPFDISTTTYNEADTYEIKINNS